MTCSLSFKILCKFQHFQSSDDIVSLISFHFIPSCFDSSEDDVQIKIKVKGRKRKGCNRGTTEKRISGTEIVAMVSASADSTSFHDALNHFVDRLRHRILLFICLIFTSEFSEALNSQLLNSLIIQCFRLEFEIKSPITSWMKAGRAASCWNVNTMSLHGF